MSLDQQSRGAVESMRLALIAQPIPELDVGRPRRRIMAVAFVSAAFVIALIGGVGLLTRTSDSPAPPATQDLTTTEIPVPSTTAVVLEPSAVERVGTRINLHDLPATFSADSAFHVVQGFGVEGASDPSVASVPLYRFELFVDGARVEGTREVTLDGDRWELIVWVFDFNEGLAEGSHVIKGVWTSPGEPPVEVEQEITFTGPA